MNTFRFPFEWAHIQPVVEQSFNIATWSEYTDVVDYITITKGKHVIITPYKYIPPRVKMYK
jgi:hypothetical protein